MTDAARSEDLGEDVARWLVSDEGVAAVDRTTGWLDGGDTELQVATRLRKGLSATQASVVQTAAAARRRARQDWEDADRLLFTVAALEQASHPSASAWRARRYAGASTIVDLCAGVGGDSLALARHAARVVAVDRDLARLYLLRHNAGVRGAEVLPVGADVLTAPIARWPLVHCDPSRRAGGRRLRRLGEYRPAVPAVLAAAADAPGAGIICSPAVDLADPDLPAGAELEFVQLGDQLLEATLWTGALRRPEVEASAVLLPEGTVRTRTSPPPTLPVGDVGEWLVEPAAAAVRARLHGEIGVEIGARRIAQRRALLTSDTDPGDSPWWRRWAVEAVLPLRAKPVRSWLRGADERPVEIAVHGADVEVGAFWRAIGRPARGPNGRRLHCIRTDDGALCVATIRT